MATLIVIYGLPGTGKTTISKRINETFEGSSRRLFTKPYEVGVDTSDRSEDSYLDAKEQAYDDLFERTKKTLEKTEVTIVEGTFTDIKNRTTGQTRIENYVELVENEGHQLLLLGIYCSDESRLEDRLILRKSMYPESRGSLEEYKLLVPAFNIDINHPEHTILIDNDDMSLDELDNYLEKSVYSKLSTYLDVIDPIDYQPKIMGSKTSD
ncbi:MAG: AAA family ATPase [Candidatus Altiarchaeota archaeon]|nr:AAA family ATPase [Candidatus Altiarchaeota archaeon]